MLRIRALINISFVSTVAFAGLAIADLDKNIVEDYLITHPSSAAAKSRGSSHAPKPLAQELVRTRRRQRLRRRTAQPAPWRPAASAASASIE